MVFFTCNNCGDSLKKKDCANHAGKCHPLALTCVDCHKDFFGNQYDAHTSCVTEAEKYGVKGFRSPVPSTAGIAKQEEWSRTVLAASQAPRLTSSQKFFLEILTRHPNVPRKKKQFQNFAKSVWKASVRQPAVVDQVYDMLESELKKIKGPPKDDKPGVDVQRKAEGNSDGAAAGNAANETANGNNGEIPGENGVEGKVEDKVVTDSLHAPKKSKKKKRKKEECDDTKEIKDSENETLEVPVTVENGSESKKSKKKKRKQESDEALKPNGNGTVDDCVEAEDSTSNKKKRKKLKQKDTEEEEEQISRNGNGIESVNGEDGSSKKDKKRKKLSNVDDNGLVQAVEDVPKKSHKKKHKKSKENKTEVTASAGQEETPVEAGEEKRKRKKKYKLQESVEDLPRKKSKPTVG